MKKLTRFGKRIFVPLRYLHKAPAFSAFLWFILGIFCYNSFQPNVQIPQLAFILLLFLSVIIARKITFPFLICGVIAIPSQSSVVGTTPITGTPRRYSVQFSHTPIYSANDRTLQKAVMQDDSFSVPVLCVSKTPILPGQKQDLIGTLKLNNSGNFNSKFTLEVDSVVSISKPSKLFQKVNRVIARQSMEMQPFLKAIYTGNRVELSKETKYLFKHNGLSHLLALSGLHIGTLICALALLLKPLMISKHSKALIYTLLPWTIIMVTGTSSSIIRALIMSTVLFSAQLHRRPASGLNSIGVAGLIILCSSPESLFSPGFQLSFSAVIGIIIAIKTASRLSFQGFRKKAVVFFLVPMAASLSTYPIISIFFNEFTPFSIIPNTFFTPLFSISFTLSTMLLPLNSIPIINIIIDHIWNFFLGTLRIFTELLPMNSINTINNWILFAIPFTILLLICSDKNFRSQIITIYIMIIATLMIILQISLQNQPISVCKLQLETKQDLRNIPVNTKTKIALVYTSPQFASEAVAYVKQNRNFHTIFVNSSEMHPKEKKDLEHTGVTFMNSNDTITVNNIAIFP